LAAADLRDVTVMFLCREHLGRARSLGLRAVANTTFMLSRARSWPMSGARTPP